MTAILPGRDWRLRVIYHTNGNQSLLGAVIIGVLGRMAPRPPWVGKAATIQENGMVSAPFMSKAGHYSPNCVLFQSVEDMTGQFSRLADEVGLGDEDRIKLFREVRLWCARDLRKDKEALHFYAVEKARKAGENL